MSPTESPVWRVISPGRPRYGGSPFRRCRRGADLHTGIQFSFTPIIDIMSSKWLRTPGVAVERTGRVAAARCVLHRAAMILTAALPPHVIRSATSCSATHHRASPRNAINERSTSTSCSDVRRPTRVRAFDRRTAVSLSTITSLSRSRPEIPSPSPGIRILKSGASMSWLVIGATATDRVESKRSSWMITAGRGFDAYTPPATVQISPRITPRRPRTPRQPQQSLALRCRRQPVRREPTACELPQQIWAYVRQEPRPATDAVRAHASGVGTRRPAPLPSCPHVTCNSRT